MQIMILMAMAESANQSLNTNDPNLSLETASKVFNWASVFFIGSLAVGVVTTVLFWWTSGIKEQYWDKQRVVLEKQTSDAKLETEKLKAVVTWRTINEAIAAKLKEVLSAKKGAVNLRYT